MNQTRDLQIMHMRSEISNYIEISDLRILKNLGYNILGREWGIETLEEDLGSSAIESLLEGVKNIEYSKLKRVYTVLKSNGAIK